jgi:hypothetical protein
MKKKTKLKTIIRQMVREEVAMAIQEVITELKQPTQKVSQPKPKKKIVEKKTFSKNPVLNDILNETANDDSDWQTMGDKTQTTNDMSNVLKQQYGDIVNGSNSTSAPVNPNDPMSKFINKDYGNTLKAMEKAAEKTRT